MKLATARQAAFGALLAIDRGGWSAECLSAKSTQLDPRDAGLASDIVFGTLRRKGELDAVIAAFSRLPVERLDPPVRIALEMALYQTRFLDRVPAHAAVNDSVELARRAGKASAASFVNAVLRRAQREPLEVAESESTPPWLRERWASHYGPDIAAEIAHASLRPPSRFIRVGNAQPPSGAESTDVPGCYLFPSGDPQSFRFQDIGSQSVVPLLDLQPGLSFLDVCSAPGNKTAQALETPLKAVACELHFSRAKGLTSLGIPVVVADASIELPFNRTFDRILVDAPCTGTGTLARNPEIKWRLKPTDVGDLAGRQTAILSNALKLLTPEGLLVYSTCSLEREENDDVVKAALARSDYRALRTMQRLPGRDPGDGFYAAVIARG